jgi:hypothetical protein
LTKTSLQLHFFFDEFETTNPLGSKTNVHKIGGLYMAVKNMPTSVSSLLHNIFPVTYRYSTDFKKYGCDAVLQPLLSDLKALEKGAQMLTNGNWQTVYGAAVMWSGDNLGIHQIFGFSPSFNSDKCCRICYVDRADRQKCFRECEVVLRNRQNYEQDCMIAEADPSTSVQSGVYCRCSLTQLQFSSVPENLCPDA